MTACRTKCALLPLLMAFLSLAACGSASNTVCGAIAVSCLCAYLLKTARKNARQREKLFILIPSHDTLCYFGTRNWCLMLARISTVDNEWDFGGNFAWACELKQVRLGCRAWRIHPNKSCGLDRLSARAITKHALLSGTPQAWPQGWISTLNLGQKALAR